MTNNPGNSGAVTNSIEWATLSKASQWTNNACESMNHVLKQRHQWRRHMLPDLVENLRSDSESIRRGRPRHLWTWKFHSTSQSSEVSPLRRWLSELQRAIQAVFSLSYKGMAGTRQSTSTNGNLTVLHRPDAGKKPGSRRRPRADSTMTQIKKRKVWMCPRVWHCTNDEKITKKQNNWKKYCKNYDEGN